MSLITVTLFNEMPEVSKQELDWFSEVENGPERGKRVPGRGKEISKKLDSESSCRECPLGLLGIGLQKDISCFLLIFSYCLESVSCQGRDRICLNHRNVLWECVEVAI